MVLIFKNILPKKSFFNYLKETNFILSSNYSYSFADF